MTGYFSKKSLFFVTLAFFAAHSTCMIEKQEILTLDKTEDKDFMRQKAYVEQLWQKHGRKDPILFCHAGKEIECIAIADIIPYKNPSVGTPTLVNRIRVDENFMQLLPQKEQEAILAHEVGHLVLEHMQKKSSFTQNQALLSPITKACIVASLDCASLGSMFFSTKKLYSIFNKAVEIQPSKTINTLVNITLACGLPYIFAHYFAEPIKKYFYEPILNYDSNKFARACEYEADEFAAKNGAAEGLILNLEKILKIEEKLCGRINSRMYQHLWRLRQHPSFLDRIARLKELKKQYQTRPLKKSFLSNLINFSNIE